MEINERIYELIDKYLNGELKGQELIDFEKQIETIPQLKDEIKIQQELLTHFEGGVLEVEESDIHLQEFLESDDAKNFQQQLNQTLAQHKKQNQSTDKPNEAKVRKLGWKPIAVAASLLLLVGFFYMNNLDSGMSSQELFAEYSKHEPLAMVTKGSTDDAIAEIEKTFNAKDYQKAKDLLATVLDTLSNEHPNRFDLELSRAISEMELGNDERAKNLFLTLSDSEYINAPKATWYYFMVLLKEGNTEKFKKEVNAYLEDGNTYKQKELKEILKELG